MKLGDLAVKATEERDALLAARFSDWCRFRSKVKFTYEDEFAFVNDCRARRGLKPIDLADWDALLREADDNGY